MSARVEVTTIDSVAEVRLCRPDKRNALDAVAFTELTAAALALADDTSVRAVVLSGEGRDFCAGVDRATFRELARGERPGAAESLPPVTGPARARGQRLVWAWRALPVPVIAAVQGHALGAGLQLALGADIRLAAADARFGALEILWGLVPDMTGTQLLPPLVGRDVALEMALTGRLVDGAEAVAVGLATRVVDDPHAAALTLAGEIAGRHPEAVRWIKHLVGLAGRVDPATGFAAEQDAMAALVGTPNQAEAVAARFEGRDPAFTDPAAPAGPV